MVKSREVIIIKAPHPLTPSPQGEEEKG